MSGRERLLGSRQVGIPTILLIVLAITTALGVGVAASTSTTAFDPYNPAWDGSSDLRGLIADDPETEVELVRDSSRYETVEPDQTVAFVIAPTEPYEADSTEEITSFVREGGTVVVFDNLESGGNELLASIGAEARIDGDVLRDEEHNNRGPLMPVAPNVSENPRVSDVDQLTLNHASAVEANGSTVLVRSSEQSYLVAEPAAELDDDTEISSRPVVTTESVAEGTVFVVSDPSITTNAMLSESDNTAFVQALYGEDEMVVFDYSHSDEFPPLASVVLSVRSSSLLQGLLGLSAIGLVAVVSTGQHRPLTHWIRRTVFGIGDEQPEATVPVLSEEEWEMVLREKHPEWDEDRIQRVIAAFNRVDSKRGDNE